MLACRNPIDRIPKVFRNTPKLCAYSVFIVLDVRRQMFAKSSLYVTKRVAPATNVIKYVNTLKRSDATDWTKPLLSVTVAPNH